MDLVLINTILLIEKYLKLIYASHTLRGHTGEVFALAWHPGESSVLASGSSDHKVTLMIKVFLAMV